jgi:uncharacterized protein YqeY
MLVEEIRKRRTAALKARDTVAKDVLSVALGDIDTLAARASREPTDDECLQVLRKLVKSNEETRSNMTDEAAKQVLTQEIAILMDLLPKTLGVSEVIAALEAVAADLRAAANPGQATGVAMKHLKAIGASVDGKIVAQAVGQLRA